MYISVSKRFRISAAHQLLGHEGKCQEIHGHNYDINVTLAGVPEMDPGSPSYGMILDFSRLKQWAKVILDRYDHTTLNDKFEPTTAEVFAALLLAELSDELDGPTCRVLSVQVFETPDSAAVASRALPMAFNCMLEFDFEQVPKILRLEAIGE